MSRRRTSPGQRAEHLGELATGAVLVRETMAPDHRVQALLRTRDHRRRARGRRPPRRRHARPARAPTRAAARSRSRAARSRWCARSTAARCIAAWSSPGGRRHVPGADGVHAELGAGRVDDRGRAACSTASAWSRRAATSCSSCPRSAAGRSRSWPSACATFERSAGCWHRPTPSPTPLLDELLYGMPFTRLEQSPLSLQVPLQHRARDVQPGEHLPRAT